MLLAPYYREYDLPWEGDPEATARFRKILRVLLIILVLLGILFPLLPRPAAPTTEDVPQRLARVMLEEKPKPPPPPPTPKPEEKPKIEPKVAMITPPPVDQHQKAHEKAQKQLNQVKDELADLRDVMDLKPMETKNLSGAVGADAHAERSLITSKVGAGSGGITSADSSRGFGGGAGSLTGNTTTAVNSGIARGSVNNRTPTAGGGGGKPGRSAEEVALLFDKNKGRIYSLYARAARQRRSARQGGAGVHHRPGRGRHDVPCGLERAPRCGARAEDRRHGAADAVRQGRRRRRDDHQTH